MAAEPYYSSDEEIAWGPLSLREIKRDLQKPRKIKYRCTDTGRYFDSATSNLTSTGKEAKMDVTKEIDKLNLSGVSVYFTPDESVQVEQSTKNETFLEKLTKVINNSSDADCTSYVTALEDPTFTKILSDNKNRYTVDNLDHIHQTLVDNSVLYEEDSEVSVVEDKKIFADSDIIVLSDSDDSFSIQENCKQEPDVNEVSSSSGSNDSHKFTESSEGSFGNYDDHYRPNEEQPLNKSESFNFNDTMEEMEMALKQGLDYVMPNDTIELTTPKCDSSSQKSSASKTKIPTIKHSHVRSPVGDYIRSKPVPSQENFKQPSKPLVNPKPVHFSPKPHNLQFKNIVSPVGVYIRNSPSIHLRQNVPLRTIPSVPLVFPVEDKLSPCGKTTTNSDFPEIVYKPAKKAVVTATNNSIKLPPNIKKLAPEHLFARHDKRKQANMNKSVVCHKLLHENELTTNSVDGSLLNSTNEDVSFLTIKQAYIK